MASAGTKWLRVLMAGGAAMVPSFVPAHAHFFDGICQDPAGIIDVINCRNAAHAKGVSGPAVVSYVLEKLAPFASVACTTSQSSGQPANPDEGDLRCFQVFDSGLILSFNLVSGLNGDRLEVSQSLVPGDRDRVILANIPSGHPVTLAEALSGAFTPIDPGSRMTCGMCHRTVDHPQVVIDGVSTWVLAGIRLNSTVRGGVAKNGQVFPEHLDEILRGLARRHGCNARPVTETCRRIASVTGSQRRFPMDDPAPVD
ncbi:MAG: hypothetical protein EBU49_01705 [Proteobacteria bacterium]|nr:hypothetical protein [Pseudomonadota bacterium]